MAERLMSWRMIQPDSPLELTESPLPRPAPGEVLLKVSACGLCHTDYGFLRGGVRPNAPLPLTLGHEIVGKAVAAAPGLEGLLGRTLLVPAVLPCGECDLCKRGRGNVCRRQKMPGNDFHGGFASHFLAPARFLCPVPEDTANAANLSVVADAVGTSYQAVRRTGAKEGDAVIIVGLGGVGIFAAQTARALGASVIGIERDERRLQAVASYVDLALPAQDTKEIRKQVARYEEETGRPPYGRKIVECSGSAGGQATAFSLLNHDAVLMLVGFTLEKIPVRLSNLMAFDARAVGNWGCLPEHFPEILGLVAKGRIVLDPFVEHFPMSRINELLEQEHHAKRPVLIPDFE